jgi:hypothetical protein
MFLSLHYLEYYSQGHRGKNAIEAMKEGELLLLEGRYGEK